MEDLFNIIVGTFALFYLVSSAKKKRRQQAESGEEEPGQRPVAPFGPFGPFEPFGPQPQEAPALSASDPAGGAARANDCPGGRPGRIG